MSAKTKEISLVSGSLPKNILLFSLPLMLSNILQVLFNISDIAVVGRFSSAEALGSVGSCTVMVSLFTGLLIGMGGGINALVARCIGAGDVPRLRRTVHTAFLVSLLYGVVIMAAGLCGVGALLRLLKTKTELYAGALLYMRVYLLGVPALALYNFGNGVLSASGDSRRPLYYLSAAGGINVLLNLFFVIVCRLGVLGVALASAISQYVSAFLILFRLFRCRQDYSLSFGEMHLDRAISGNVLLLGVPAGLQNAIFAVANLFIQSAVNSFDTVVVEGNSAAANADVLVFDLMAAFYLSCTTFMGQNIGAGKKKRVLQSYLLCLAYSFFAAVLAGGLLLLFGRQFLSIFTTEQAVIAEGVERLKLMACTYCISAFMDCTIAASRGLGKTVVPTVVVIMGSCVFRIVWIYTVFAHFRTLTSLYLLYAFSWAITALFEIAYFLYAYKKQMAITGTDPAGV